MKKNLFIFATLVAALASCSSEDALVEGQGTNQNPDVAIGFKTYSNKATRAAENSTSDYTLDLYEHHTNFAVWGYKNTEAARVFDDQLVSGKAGTAAVNYTQAEIDAAKAIVDDASYVAGSNADAELVATKTTSDIKTPAGDATWSYTPIRFWDKAADDYEFYAAAPRTDNNDTKIAWVLNGSEDKTAQAGHYFTLSSVRMYGSNLSTVAANSDSYIESFATAPKNPSVCDVDYMIADKKNVETAAFTTDPVELDFIHILSRLNVTIQTTVASPAVVTLKSLEVFGLKNTGDFNESKEDADGTGKTSRWTTGAETYKLAATTDYTIQNVTTKDKYVLQSLVIPQETELQTVKLDGTDLGTTPEAYIKIVYTIDPDGTGTVPAETYTAYYNLATVFGVTGTNKLAFYEGWMNTLNITIDPTQINFTAKSAPWATNLNKDLTVE